MEFNCDTKLSDITKWKKDKIYKITVNSDKILSDRLIHVLTTGTKRYYSIHIEKYPDINHFLDGINNSNITLVVPVNCTELICKGRNYISDIHGLNLCKITGFDNLLNVFTKADKLTIDCKSINIIDGENIEYLDIKVYNREVILDGSSLTTLVINNPIKLIYSTNIIPSVENLYHLELNIFNDNYLNYHGLLFANTLVVHTNQAKLDFTKIDLSNITTFELSDSCSIVFNNDTLSNIISWSSPFMFDFEFPEMYKLRFLFILQDGTKVLNTKKTIYDFAHLFLKAIYRSTITMDIRRSHKECHQAEKINVKLLLEYAERESISSYTTKPIF